MAHDTKDLEARALEAIQEHKLRWIQDIPDRLGITRATLYNHGLDKLDSIKTALAHNRYEAAESMTNKWIESDNATLQIAAFKVLATEEMRQKLTTTEVKADHTSKGEQIGIVINFTQRDEEGD